jgi:hypothetical protein
MPHFKKLTEKQSQEFVRLVKMLLHAGRDCMRNRDEDTRNFRFNVNNGYYGEVYGMFRTLRVLGYSSLNDLDALKHKLEEEVLVEEGFRSGTHQCDFCVEHFGKDGTGRTRKDLENANV